MAIITGNGYLIGGPGNDTITGGSGTDVLFGNGGSDTLRAGAGPDFLYPDNNFGVDGPYVDDGAADAVDGGGGFDRAVLRFENLTVAVIANLADPAVQKSLAGTTVVNVEEFELVLGSGNDRITLGLGNDVVLAGAGNDEIHGGSGADSLQGEGGDDVLRGGAGADFIVGGDGDDRLTGGPDVDTLDGSAGTDTAIFSGASSDYEFRRAGSGIIVTNTVDGSHDFVHAVEFFTFSDGTFAASDFVPTVYNGTAGDDFLEGTYLNDELNGLGGNDVIWANAGNDKLNGGGGHDFLSGGAGDDRLSGGAGVDFIDGGDGVDTAIFSGVSSNYVFGTPESIGSESPQGSLKVTNITDGTIEYVLFVENFQFSDRTISANDITGTRGTYLDETITGTPGNDGLIGSFGDDIINGLAGNDSLEGGNDWLFHDEGNSGNDTLNGGAGNDWLDGGDGDDFLNGGEGVDRTLLIFGGAQPANFSLAANPTLVTAYGTKTLSSIEGADISGSNLANTITGGSAHDFIWGASGDDTLRGAGGDDWLEGGNGNDKLFGGAGNDQLVGGNDNGNDALEGGEGNDWLVGVGGDDRLLGNNGADILVGGDGSDRLTGGAGDDILVFGRLAIGTSRSGEHDIVTDFQKGSDKLDFSALYLGHEMGSVSAGSAAAGEAVGSYGVIYNITDGKTFVYGDTDGVAGADFVIEMSGSIALARADIIATEAEWNTATGGIIAYDEGDSFLHGDVGAPYYWYYSIGFDA